MPTKWLQVRVNGSKYGSGIPPRRAFCGSRRGRVYERERESERPLARGERVRGESLRVRECKCICVRERGGESERDRDPGKRPARSRSTSRPSSASVNLSSPEKKYVALLYASL